MESFARQRGGGPGDAGLSPRAAGRLCGVRGACPGSWSLAGAGERGLRRQRGAGRGPQPDKGGPGAAASARSPWWRAAPLQPASEPSLCFPAAAPAGACWGFWKPDSGLGAPPTAMPGRCMGARTESRRCGSLATRPWLAQPAYSLSSPLCNMGTRSHPTHGLVGGLVVLQMLIEVFSPLAPHLPPSPISTSANGGLSPPDPGYSSFAGSAKKSIPIHRFVSLSGILEEIWGREVSAHRA